LFYGCETWPFTLREEHIEGVREQGAEVIFGPKREEVADRRLERTA